MLPAEGSLSYRPLRGRDGFLKDRGGPELFSSHVRVDDLAGSHDSLIPIQWIPAVGGKGAFVRRITFVGAVQNPRPCSDALNFTLVCTSKQDVLNSEIWRGFVPASMNEVQITCPFTDDDGMYEVLANEVVHCRGNESGISHVETAIPYNGIVDVSTVPAVGIAGTDVAGAVNLTAAGHQFSTVVGSHTYRAINSFDYVYTEGLDLNTESYFSITPVKFDVSFEDPMWVPFEIPVGEAENVVKNNFLQYSFDGWRTSVAEYYDAYRFPRLVGTWSVYWQWNLDHGYNLDDGAPEVPGAPADVRIDPGRPGEWNFDDEEGVESGDVDYTHPSRRRVKSPRDSGMRFKKRKIFGESKRMKY